MKILDRLYQFLLSSPTRRDHAQLFLGRRLTARRAAPLFVLLAGASPIAAQTSYDPIPPAPAPEITASEWTRMSVGRPAPAVAAPLTQAAPGLTNTAPRLTTQPVTQAVHRPAPVPASPRRTGVPPAYLKVAPPGQHATKTVGQTPTLRTAETPAPGTRTAETRATDPRGAANSRVTPLGKLPVAGNVSQVHFEKAPDADFMQPLAQGAEPPAPGHHSGHKSPLPPGMPFPGQRLSPPSILGSQLGLQPGETATERSLRLMSVLAELQSTIESLERRNTELEDQIKHKDGQLLLAIREIKAARTDVSTAWDDLKRLQEEMKLLKDKVRDADRDNAALLQSLAPLLQKLLEGEATPPAAELEE